jgi:hypothetical protein
MLAPGLPGRLKWFASPSSIPVVISSTLMTPTNLERDEKTGSIFITSIFTGKILKVSL